MIENIDSIIRNLNQRLGGIVGTDFALDKVSESNASRIFQTHGNALALNRLEDGTTGEVSVYNWFGEILYLHGNKDTLWCLRPER